MSCCDYHNSSPVWSVSVPGIVLDSKDLCLWHWELITVWCDWMQNTAANKGRKGLRDLRGAATVLYHVLLVNLLFTPFGKIRGCNYGMFPLLEWILGERWFSASWDLMFLRFLPFLFCGAYSWEPDSWDGARFGDLVEWEEQGPESQRPGCQPLVSFPSVPSGKWMGWYQSFWLCWCISVVFYSSWSNGCGGLASTGFSCMCGEGQEGHAWGFGQGFIPIPFPLQSLGLLVGQKYPCGQGPNWCGLSSILKKPFFCVCQSWPFPPVVWAHLSHGLIALASLLLEIRECFLERWWYVVRTGPLI